MGGKNLLILTQAFVRTLKDGERAARRSDDCNYVGVILWNISVAPASVSQQSQPVTAKQAPPGSQQMLEVQKNLGNLDNSLFLSLTFQQCL